MLLLHQCMLKEGMSAHPVLRLLCVHLVLLQCFDTGVGMGKLEIASVEQ